MSSFVRPVQFTDRCVCLAASFANPCTDNRIRYCHSRRVRNSLYCPTPKTTREFDRLPAPLSWWDVKTLRGTRFGEIPTVLFAQAFASPSV